MCLFLLGDRFSWLRDNEFARQTLAGVNPVDIQRLRVHGFLVSSIIQCNDLTGATIFQLIRSQAMK